MLRAGDLRRVQAAADVDERLAVAREFGRGGVGEAGGVRDLLRDLGERVEPREVLWRRDDGERPRVARRRLADVNEFYPVALLRELLEVADRLVVVDELEVGADFEAKDGFWCWNLRLERRDEHRRDQYAGEVDGEL